MPLFDEQIIRHLEQIIRIVGLVLAGVASIRAVWISRSKDQKPPVRPVKRATDEIPVYRSVNDQIAPAFMLDLREDIAGIKTSLGNLAIKLETRDAELAAQFGKMLHERIQPVEVLTRDLRNRIEKLEKRP